jgi:hypothetical protein
MQAAPQPDSDATTGPPAPCDLAAALDRLWTRFLPDILERANILSAAVSACATVPLTAEQRNAAHAAAHKLAGTLGTFSLARGTELAREFELAFAGNVDPDPVLTRHLQTIASELRAIIDSRK